jgi:hypothetical protein
MDGVKPRRRQRQEVGNEAPMIITPRMVADLVRRTYRTIRSRRGKRAR